MSESQDHAWMGLLHAALLELDPIKLPQRIEEASHAIQSRMQEISGTGNSLEERRALADALQSLRSLRLEMNQQAS